ncbi:MAG: SIMPL domain-containing protein [bacterium]|nr:SIMPL domain-containing protein [bacterium]
MENTNLRKVGVILGVVLVIFVAAKTLAEFKAMSYIGKTTPVTNVISVSGKGEILATPDIATFSFGVTEEAQTVEVAQKSATEKMNVILEYVKTSGVSEKDVKTTSYNIYPRYEYRAISASTPYYGGGKQVLVAYVVSQTIEVKVRKLTDAGKLLSGIGEFGATDVSGLTFTQDKQDALVREARDKAIQDARNQAKALAKSLGVRLGDIISFSDNQGYPGPIYYAKSASMGMGGGESAPVPDIPAGENKIVSNVTITYEIK